VSPSGWTVEHHRGPAAEFHAREVAPGTGRSVWWFEVERPTLVLGSTQADGVVDRARADAAGVDVVRRRSGGGAVWLEPGGASWVDLVIPSGDPLWDDDVSRSSGWVADAWVRCLGALGVLGSVAHQGPMVHRRWSRLVCFAGLAPGEVTVAGRKVVGVSQRRSRHGARFQCALLHRWDPEPMLDLLVLPDDERVAAAADLRSVAAGVGPWSSMALHSHLIDALPA
jgi:lipoate-protein ligase A